MRKSLMNRCVSRIFQQVNDKPNLSDLSHNLLFAHQVEQLEQRLLMSASPLITEFMAANVDTLADQDGDSSDWIEIHNPTTAPVNLNGWSLTDDLTDLSKWHFPDITMQPGEYLVVFASNKDIAIADDELHTNFKLSAAGEYLALVEPDGLTIAQSFTPTFPPQNIDVSYGIGMEGGVATTIIASGDHANVFIPTDGSLGLSWTESDFNDSSWTINGPTGIGYENYPADFATLIETEIPKGTTSAYIRIPFTLSTLSGIDSMLLRMKYDDGFAVYLNGQKIASANAPINPIWSDTATTNHSDSLAIHFVDYDITDHVSDLQQGQNVLAIHGLNLFSGSSDMLLLPELQIQGTQVQDPSDIGFLSTPTPGAGNTESFDGFVADTQFSVDRGFYTQPFNLEITSATIDAIIVYTTDGSEPKVDNQMNVTNGILYNSAFEISSTSSIRATAFKQDMVQTNVDTHTYLFISDILTQSPDGSAPVDWPTGSVNGQSLDYGMDPNIVDNPLWQSQMTDALTQIPSISISTDLDNLFDPSSGIYVNASQDGIAWERPTSVELIDPNGTEEGFQIDAGLRIRGGFSRGGFNPKHSFRLFFRSDYGDAKLNYPLFGNEGVDEFDAVDLRTAQNYAWSNSTFNDELHNSFLRDVYARDLQGAQDQPYTRSRYYHLYINGQYWGMYMTEERPEADYAESYFGGDENDYDAIKASGGRIEATDGNRTAWDTFSNLSDAGYATDASYYFVQGKNPDGTDNLAFEKHLDVDNLIDFMINVFFTANVDMPTTLGDSAPNNFWAIRPQDGTAGWKWIAHDNEHSMGASNHNVYHDETNPTNSGGSPGKFNPKYLHDKLMANSEYRMRFADRVHQEFFNDGVLTTDNAQALMQARADQINMAIIAESARWGDQHNEPPLNKNTWQTEVTWLTDTFLAQRNNIVLNQFRAKGIYPSTSTDAPSFNQHGGSVGSGFELLITNSESNGTIYYTLDGSDPRLQGGAISSTALVYNPANSLVITQPTMVKARLLRTGQWSAANQALFTIGIPADATNLRVTEIHYNPTGATATEIAAGFDDGDMFEFIECSTLLPPKHLTSLA